MSAVTSYSRLQQENAGGPGEGKLGDVTQQRRLEKILVQRWSAPAAYNTE